ncbi:hypothetical protein BUALT_Bualt03G0161700 [Buddleja alternifolia]|uniref:C2H2-type domain-containing protein n=1 Tax=Buddleja alternifolia TaxID=168488 RepID=A0AAV6Y122_9LAMI|nr:hypothetical protein BUALT_Bualt03G0161700 [Buddleja alternifolia]
MVNDQEEDVDSISNMKKSDVFEEQNKIWVKLKIPKEEEEMKKNYSNDSKRVCNFCNKVFSSGKALGGHMRIHVQRKDVLNFNKKPKVHQPINFKKLQNHPPQIIDFVKKKKKTTMKPTCMICGKDFPSMKSLFGHMRCHPERVWRGINPPPSVAAKNTSTSSSSSLSDDDDDDQMELDLADVEKNRVVDLTESLRGWSVTARRGRRATTAVVASTSEVSSSEDDQLREAVNYLMILKNSQRSVVVNGESDNKSDGQEWVDQEDDHDYSSDDDSVDTNSKAKKKKKKHRKKVKLCDLEIAKTANPNTPPILFPSPDKYRCSVCDKSFPTGQALGGHRSSHNKIKIIIQTSIDQSQNPNPNPNPTIESSSGEASHMGRRILTFDLNEAPPTSMDEIGVESDYSLGNYNYAFN